MRTRIVLVGAVAVVAAVGVVGQAIRTTPALHACAILTPEVFRSALAWDAQPGRPDVPERTGGPKATLCNIRSRDDGERRNVNAFGVSKGGRDFFEQMRTAGARAKTEFAGDDYVAFVLELNPAHPEDGESLFILSHGQYVNANLTGFPAGSARRLAPAIEVQLEGLR
ncbi:MAG: hypothetical protein QOI61_961 [Actinomycetota bacterium]|jgi:hypothetical protein